MCVLVHVHCNTVCNDKKLEITLLSINKDFKNVPFLDRIIELVKKRGLSMGSDLE